ncbi:DUF2207 domain-containing protein [Pedobacter caeni]|uniref:Predicted membrane protein n=1 Tax=Pedobacter caeni TaxID=288992 RepID=A0A1M5JFR7_9SPHI|nr:DUF2207 domain-containing protein [Pedobacter caeni]SHG39341.1 Predicted membrane protein [Pedobacter caeni]
MTKKLFRPFSYLLLFILFQFPQQLFAQTERILSFHSNIKIDSSGLVRITELIKVNATGDQIKRGLVRTLPLYRTDVYSTRKKMDFLVESVLKNGVEEPFSTKESNGSRSIYIGQESVLLEPGIYEYQISYSTRGQVGFFKDYDELYWNVTGNEWAFPIDTASASIQFPAGAKGGNTVCYTGPAGSKDHNCNSFNNADGSITFKTSQGLAQGEGFTIAAAFSTGFIKKPSFTEKLYTEYKELAITALLLIALGGYLFFTWNRYGVDPATPTVIPSFNVPGGFSPAMLRYFNKRKSDQKGFATAIVNMAVKKVIRIKKEAEDYVLERASEDTSVLSPEEQQIYKHLLASRSKIAVDSSNNNTISSARTAYENTVKVKLDFENYFVKHSKHLTKGVLATVIAFALFMYFVGGGYPFVLLFFAPFIGVGLFCIYNGIRSLKSTYGLSLFLVLFGLGFTGGPGYMLYQFIGKMEPTSAVFIILATLMFIAFIYLIKAPTVYGAAMLSEIAGFKMYLETAEQHRLNLLNPPELSPQLFEKFLPYAMALDVENAWGAKFEQLFEGTDYQPDWYSGDRFSYRAFGSGMAQPLSRAFDNATPSISSSSGSGSSSGSSGSSSWSSGSSSSSSGSSGGGGGGGGGGGW